TTWLHPSDFIHFNPVSLTHGFGSNNGAAGYKLPGVAIEWMELEGPITSEWPPRARKELFGTLPLVELSGSQKGPRPVRLPANGPIGYTPLTTNPTADAEQLLKDFTARACRRPPSRDELAPFLAIATTALDEGRAFEDAMR